MIELIGFTLWTHYTFEVIVFLEGGGSNGKSVFLEFVRVFLGLENVSAITPQQFEDKFATAHLYGKLANICPDIPNQPIRNAAFLKSASGNDLLHAQHKFKAPFAFTNYAKLIFSCNEIPPSWDMSDAFHRRNRVIDFPNRFEPKDSNFMPRNNLLAKMTTETELSGVLNLALEGLQRLFEQGQLTGDPSIEEKKDDYIRRSDTIHYFLRRYCSHVPEEEITKRALYDLYLQYCHSQGKTASSDQWFGKKVKMHLTFASESRPEKTVRDEEGNEKKRRVTVWRGIAFDQDKFDRENSESYVDTDALHNKHGGGV
ncbi:MAG: phage/plasmid primase, P4 family [Candidatus Thorarchaeota archaeon]